MISRTWNPLRARGTRPLLIIICLISLSVLLLSNPEPSPVITPYRRPNSPVAVVNPPVRNPLTPLKNGLEKWKPGRRRRILITGGAGQIGQAILPSLLKDYAVDILDVAHPPSTLPISNHLHYHQAQYNTIYDLLSTINFVGVIHLAGVSLPEWCEKTPQICEQVNLGGTNDLLAALSSRQIQKRWWRGEVTGPWALFGSGVEVHPEESGSGDDDSNQRSAWRRIMISQEEVIRRAVDHSSIEQAPLDKRQSSHATLRAAIVRLSTVYGFQPQASIPDSTVESIIRAGVTATRMQYDSDASPLDLLHVTDAVDGMLSMIRRLEGMAAEGGLEEIDLVSGKRRSQKEIATMVREMTNGQGPWLDIGNDKAAQAAWRQYDSSAAWTLLDWKPSTDTQTGLQWSIENLHRASANWALEYHQDHCPTSPSLPPRVSSPVLPEDERNRVLGKLDGCTVNIAFKRDGFLDHVKCPSDRTNPDGTDTKCTVDNNKVVSYNWDASVFYIRKVEESWKGLTGKKGRKVSVRFEEEKGRGWLGLPPVMDEGYPEGRSVGFELFKEKGQGQVTFDLEVQEDQSNLRLMLPGTTRQIVASSKHATDSTTLVIGDSASREFDMRMAVLCCPFEGNWPLLLDDYESADIRFGTTGDIPFNSSRRSHTCHRAEEAYKFNTAHLSTSRSETTKPKSKYRQPSKDPHQWVMKDMPPCWNDCSAPSQCVQTGSCRCVQAECPALRTNPLEAHAYSKGATIVPTLDWHDVLLPAFQSYLAKHDEFPSLHVVGGYPNEDKIESAECHKLQSTHCFSGDSILYKAMRAVSVSSDQADLIVLPVYQHCDGAEFLLHDVYRHASETIPGIKEGTKKVALVLTHDWGICIAFAWEIWSARQNHQLYPDWILNNVIVWSVMGDYDSPCYRPHQDVVIPPRTCRSNDLKEAFGDLEKVMPARNRPRLITWAGTYWGTGKSERLRMTCDRGGAGERELVHGGGPQSSWVGKDYMKELGTARFCPQPRGIAGWSPRVNDAIYAGCIPVLTAEGTHYPFANSLDWSKFSVRISPTDLDSIESILAAIPLEEVEMMQANLMVVRDAFIFSGDEKPEEELEKRGPMYWALHEAGMRMRMEYPAS